MNRTASILRQLQAYESRNVTFIAPDGSWPIVWERAKGVHVWDAEGKMHLDLTAAFGVAAAGHANPSVVRAGRRQMAKLLHAMGDVHPHEPKARLARELSRLTFERWSRGASGSSRSRTAMAQKGDRRRPPSGAAGKTIFCNSGFEAVEAALKTAMLLTRKRGVIAFEGAYHGLGYGALAATHREHFRGPFESQLGQFGHFVKFPAVLPEHTGGAHGLRLGTAALRSVEDRIRTLCRNRQIGAVLVEPVQVRGGINLPPLGFLPMLRRVCDEHGALLIVDEIYTGFGRTGKWFACEHSGVVPDLICLGKALTGGFPLSACVGRADLMDAAWPLSGGEAIHTSTFLGHPVGCAMALAQLDEIRRQRLVERSARSGLWLLKRLNALRTSRSALIASARGVGLLAGIELRLADGSPATGPALRVIQVMLRRGFILLPEGEHANVISFTPPLTISRSQLERAVRALEEALQ